MNAPIDTEPMRKCSKCSVTKPATLDNFRPRCRDDGGGVNGLRSQCRSCMTRSDSYRDKMRRGADREHGRRTATSRPIIGEREHVKQPKPCDACCSMPWRVNGAKCHHCGLAAGVEAKPELVLRRWYERVV